MVVGGLEQVPPHVALGEVEPVDVLGLCHPQTLAALRQQDVSRPGLADARDREQFDAVVGVSRPGRFDGDHARLLR